MTKPIYAVGDIHGHAAELDRVLARIEADGGAAAEVVFLGDYADRGPDSRGVIDRLAAGKAEGRNCWTLSARLAAESVRMPVSSSDEPDSRED